MRKYLFLLSVPVLLYSCGEEKTNDLVKQPSKDGSVEVGITTDHLNPDKDVIKITYTTWVKNVAVSSKTVTDTVPSLGMYDAETGNTDANGDPTTVRAKKEYEIFVTVK